LPVSDVRLHENIESKVNEITQIHFKDMVEKEIAIEKKLEEDFEKLKTLDEKLNKLKTNVPEKSDK